MLALALELVTRKACRNRQLRFKHPGRLSFRTLIVWTSAEAGRLAHVHHNPGSGFVPLGYVRGSDPVIWANTHRNFKGKPEVFAEDLATSLELLERRHLGPGREPSRSGSLRPRPARLRRPRAGRGGQGGRGDLYRDHRDRAGRPVRQRVRLWPAGVGGHDTGAVVEARLYGHHAWMGAAREGFRAVFRF